jgi:hypothetical protein
VPATGAAARAQEAPGVDPQERSTGTRRREADAMASSPVILLLSRDGSRACTQVTPRGTSSVSTTARSPGTRRGSPSRWTTARGPVTPPTSRNGPAACTPARLGATGSSMASSLGTQRRARAAAAPVDRAAEPSMARTPASQPSKEGSPACTPATRRADWAPPSGASSPGTTGSGGRTPRKRGPAPSALQTGGAGRVEGSRRRSSGGRARKGKAAARSWIGGEQRIGGR